MMTDAGVLAAALARWRNFDECLLTDFRMTRGVYAAHLEFDYIWGEGWTVRPDLDETPVRVTLHLHGVERMELVGGLSDAQRADPESIGWGVMEVSVVYAEAEAGGGLRVDILWPGDRRLSIVANEAELEEPETVLERPPT